MKYIKQSVTKFVAAAAVMIAMAIAASRQLYLFLVFRNADGLLDTQGGRYHLWLALGATLLAALAACLMFLFFLGLGKSLRPEGQLSPLGPASILSKFNLNAISPVTDNLNVTQWAQLNEWSVKGQADDRRPVNGSVARITGAASAHRSTARLRHQVMSRQWSGERHE